jgi:hypothetical protein
MRTPPGSRIVPANPNRAALYQLDVRRWSWETESGNRTPPVVQLFLPALGSTASVFEGHRGEAFVTRVATLACSACTSDDVVLDIGASEGFYAMVAAAHGCGAIAFDLLAGCARMFEAARATGAAQLNSTAFAAERVQYIRRPLGSGDALNLPVEELLDGCGTMAASYRLNMSMSRSVSPIDSDGIRALMAPWSSISFVKIDVEGAELVALASLRLVLRSVQHLVIELTPDLWRKFGSNLSHGIPIVANLLGKGGFGAARTSTGCSFHRPQDLYRYLQRDCRGTRWTGSCGWGSRIFYREGQIDIWFARDPALFKRANPLITGFLGKGSSVLYPDDPHGKNLTCPEPGARYLRPKHRSVADAEAARLEKCERVCGGFTHNDSQLSHDSR